jgi:hypothetical protein
MTKSNINVNEGQVTFKRVEGHKHDGLTSSLIDTSKYSIFDFIASENTRDVSRRSRQENNKNVLRTFIVDTIEGRVLNPEGIRIQANAITAREIVAGTITADELSSNIVLVNNVIRSANYVNNSTQKSGWAIFSNGDANFNNVVVRGTVVSGEGSIGGWTINTSSLASGSTALYSNGQAVFGNTAIFSNGRITNGSLIISASGVLDATGAIVRGRIEADEGVIGGWLIDDGLYSLAANGINNNEMEFSPTGGFSSKKYLGGLINTGASTEVQINYGNLGNGIDVVGTSDLGSINTTEIRSSFVKANQLFIRVGGSDTDIKGLIDGKASSTHLHESQYVNTSGDTMTGILFGTGIDMTGNLRYGGQVYSDNTDGFAAFGAVGAPASVGGYVFRANQVTTLWARSFTPEDSHRPVYVNSASTLFVGANVSSLRYKNNITNAEIDTENFLKTRVVNFYYNDELRDLETQPVKQRHVGLIAEELDELGLSDLLVYDDQGRPDILKKDSIPFYLLKVCQDQEAKIKALEDRIQTLEGV